MTVSFPHRILGLALALWIALLSVPAEAAPKTSPAYEPPRDFAVKAAEYMRARVHVTGFSGAVLVAHHGEPILREGYGLASQEYEIANTPKTKFRLGSLTKQFTAASVLLLEQRGKLKVSDPVGRHLPDWPTPWAEVTLHHLLSHTSGLPPIAVPALIDVSGLVRPAPPTPPRGLKDLIRPGEAVQALEFKPGEKFAYNNIAYMILGFVIEKVSGKSYSEFLRDEVFRPLGMKDTGCEEPGMILKQRADGYTSVGGTLATAGYVDMRFPYAAGNVYSTADDLLVWDRVLASDRLLGPAAKDKLFAPVQAGYAYGWWVQTKFTRKVQWHRGNVNGFVAIMVRYPEEGLLIVVLSNVERTQVLAVSNELAAIALGEPYQLPHEWNEAHIDPATFDTYVGTYHKSGLPDDTFEFAREEKQLLVKIPNAGSFPVFPESSTRLFARALEFDLSFVMDEKAGGVRVVIRNQGEESLWVRAK